MNEYQLIETKALGAMEYLIRWINNNVVYPEIIEATTELTRLIGYAVPCNVKPEGAK
jgi:hypothetical protein